MAPFVQLLSAPKTVRTSLALPLLVAALFAAPASAVNIDWVPIGNPGNAADTTTFGAVANSYVIGKYEVTNAQYAEFLNAKAASDPLALYNTSIGSDATFGGITQSGSSGSYSYSVKVGFADKPVVYVSFYDSLRFANWLNNGQGSGDTETGAYTLLGGTETPSNWSTVTRNGGANMFLTSENEWYKAAYYDALSTSYFDYPTGTNSATGCVGPGSDTGNSANCYPYAYPPGTLTDVGAYSLSDGPYGTYDQGGNVFEWTELIVGVFSARAIAGGSWSSDARSLAASILNIADPTQGFTASGFRVASLIPEPGTGLLLMTGLLGLAYRQRRHGRAA